MISLISSFMSVAVQLGTEALHSWQKKQTSLAVNEMGKSGLAGLPDQQRASLLEANDTQTSSSS